MCKVRKHAGRTGLVLMGAVLTLILLFSAAGWAEMVEPEMKELKLLVSKGVFEDRLGGYAQCWDIVKALAAEKGVGVVEAKDPFAEGVRKVMYLDTASGELAKQNLILRLRYKVKNNVPSDKADLTVKHRSPRTDAVDSESVKPAPGVECDYKIETDVSGFSGGIVGKNAPAAALSCTVKGIPDKDIAGDTLGVFSRYVATLGEVGVPLDSKLEVVAGTAVKEYKAVPGELDFGQGLTTEVEMSVWYAYESGKLVIGEVSYELSPKPDTPAEAITRSFDFFNALQEKMSSILFQPSSLSHQSGSGGMGLKTQVLRDTLK